MLARQKERYPVRNLRVAARKLRSRSSPQRHCATSIAIRARHRPSVESDRKIHRDGHVMTAALHVRRLPRPGAPLPLGPDGRLVDAIG